MGWEERTSDAYWEVPSYGEWTGSGWKSWEDSGYYKVGLRSLGWNTGYAPTKFRIAFTGASSLGIVIISNSLGDEKQSNDVSSLQEISFSLDLSVGNIIITADLLGIEFTITKIEFLVADVLPYVFPGAEGHLRWRQRGRRWLRR